MSPIHLKKQNSNFKKKPCVIEYNSMGHLLTQTAQIQSCPINHKCNCGEIKCKNHHYCVKIDQICDGIRHCLEGDDESLCGNSNYF